MSTITESFLDALNYVIFGTVDLVALFKERYHIVIVDYKFGRGAVDDADINIQGQAYATAAMQKYSWAQTIEVHFILPRRNETTTHTYTRQEIEGFVVSRLRYIVARALSDDKELTPHSEACRFCGERLTCKALSSKLLPLAEKYHGGYADFEVSLYEKHDPALVDDPLTLGRMKNLGLVLDRWTKAVNKRAIEFAVETGVEVPGYKLTHRKPTIKIADVNEAFEAVNGTMSGDLFREACSVSFPTLVKQYATATGMTQKAARPALELLLLKNGVIEDSDGMSSTPFLRKDSSL